MSTPACASSSWRPSCAWVSAAGSQRPGHGLGGVSCRWRRRLAPTKRKGLAASSQTHQRRPCPATAPAHAPPKAIAKYGKGQATDDLAAAVGMLFERNLEARLPLMARLAPNDFRSERMYTEEVDALLKRHQVGFSLHPHACYPSRQPRHERTAASNSVPVPLPLHENFVHTAFSPLRINRAGAPVGRPPAPA